jgi:hypothetical protein
LKLDVYLLYNIKTSCNPIWEHSLVICESRLFPYICMTDVFVIICYVFYFLLLNFIFCGVGFVRRTLCLLGRCCITWVTLPALFSLVVFQIGSCVCFLLRLASDYDPPTYLYWEAGIIGVNHMPWLVCFSTCHFNSLFSLCFVSMCSIWEMCSVLVLLVVTL